MICNLSIYLSIYFFSSLYLSTYLSIYFFSSLYLSLFFYLSIYFFSSLYLSIYLFLFFFISIYLSIYLSVISCQRLKTVALDYSCIEIWRISYKSMWVLDVWLLLHPLWVDLQIIRQLRRWNFIFLTAWWLLFCQKIHETQGCRIFSMDLIFTSIIYLFIIII